MHFSLLSLLSLLPLTLAHSGHSSAHLTSLLHTRDFSTSALKLTLSGPKSVSTVEDVKLSGTLKNVGDQDAWVYKEGSVLDETPTESFTVKKNGGGQVAFRGVKPMMQRNLPEESFLKIAPGQTVKFSHKLSALYDFSNHGEGSYTFTPRVTPHAFYGSKPPQLLADILAVFHSALPSTPSSETSATIHLSGDLVRRHLYTERDEIDSQGHIVKRAVAQCSNANKAKFISSAYKEGKALAKIARDYARSQPFGTVTRKYFGLGGGSRAATVLNLVATENSNARTMSCTDDYNSCQPGVIAYTLIATTNMYYCTPFFTELTTTALCGKTTVADRNIRGATVLHELTHALANTEDYGYGMSYATMLATWFGAAATNNADNYNLFSTEVYATTKC